ncbi:MAG TPA: ABC transporter ATP-binding protein [Candidatus Limnocylindria bacterium]|jgi:ATP-binding cassette subfamily B protein|nr:ABC transporter ATP-binding protein [Candidatus Limnocylindria bacterium]
MTAKEAVKVRQGGRGLLAVLGYLRPYPVFVALAVGLLLVNIGIEMTLPRIVGAAVSAYQETLAATESSRPFQFVWLFAGLVVTRFCVGLILGRVRNRLVQRSLADLRSDIYDALQRHAFSYHDRMSTGELISRSTADAWKLQDFFFACLFLSVDIAVAMLVILVLVFRISVPLGGIMLATLLPTTALIAYFAAKLQPQWRKVHDQHGAMTTVIQENIAGVRVVKAFARERDEIVKFQARRDEFLRTVMATVDDWAARVPMAQFLFGLSMPLVLWVGGRMVIRGELTVGALTTVVLYLMAVGHRLGMVGQFTNIVQNASAAAERIMEILDEPRAVVSGSKALPVRFDASGFQACSVAFEGVSFGYAQDKPALRDLRFKVEPGQTVGLVGPTGAGKSTLVSLIPRYRDAAAGRVLIDGIDVRELRLPELRGTVGTAFQEPFLFSTSVRENIAFGRPGASLEEIENAARVAQADEFIRRLERGYDTIVGERGVNLSGGQKQRVALARAFLLNPRILILDDTTAAVDSKTEHLIQDAMRAVSRGRTTFIIGHRLSSVQHADVILVLVEGRLVAQGTHTELLAGNAYYAEMAARQAH